MEKMIIKGVAKDNNVSRISIVGLNDTPGVAFKVFNKLAQAKVNIDIILQSVGRDGTKDITFTVTEDQSKDALEALEEIKDVLEFKKIVADTSVSKVSIVGAGMETHPGVASKMFEALADANINIQMISTSEIKISVLIDRAEADRAVSAIHAKFFD